MPRRPDLASLLRQAADLAARTPAIWLGAAVFVALMLDWLTLPATLVLLAVIAAQAWAEFSRGKGEAGTPSGTRLASTIIEALRHATSTADVRAKTLTTLLHEIGWSRGIIFARDRVGRHEMLLPVHADGFELDALVPFVYRLDRGTDVIPRAVLDMASTVVRNAPDDWRCDQKLVSTFGLVSYLVTPLVSADRAIGAILLDTGKDSRNPAGLLSGLEHAAHIAAISLENATLYEKVKQLAIVDGLTELYNHRHFQETIRQELDRANRYPEPVMHFSLIMVDVDHFKNLNDTHGHQAGDAVLIQLGRIFQNLTRKVDLVARYGGEEFVLLLPSTTKEGALILAERLRRAVEAHSFDLGPGLPQAKATVSIGVSTFAEDGTTGPDLIRAADEGLYEAKRGGRNKIHCIRPPRETGAGPLDAGPPRE